MGSLTGFPAAFYISVSLLVVCAFYSWTLRDKAIGLPMLAVFGTVAAWYLGDAFYNDYYLYVTSVGEAAMEATWWQIGLFCLAFSIFAPFCNRFLNKKLLFLPSRMMQVVREGGLQNEQFQAGLDKSASILFSAWIFLMLIALFRTDFNFLGLFAPYIYGKHQPWGRGQIGGGFDALISFAGYLHIMLAAAFGVIWALATNPRTRLLAMVVSLLGLPWFFLDRIRNTMLAVALPGILAWIFLRVRSGIFLKLFLLFGFFILVEGWMRFIIQTRSGADISVVFTQIGMGGVRERLATVEVKHQGLNMLEELGWINHFIDKGTYSINYGRRYFAEFVNPIPRALWSGKPFIGRDYAMARGQRMVEGIGVTATISTGMIGQGVVNFGPFFGVLAAALLMGLWAAILARQDLKGDKTGRLLLYMLGLVLTFNLGRDITLITLYPFLFGYIILSVWAQVHGEK
jgi:hypothetical protein